MAIIKKFRIKSFKNKRPLVSLNKISLSYGKRQILDNISFKIDEGSVVGLLGPNGVGKSTIFNLITGLIKPDHGSINFKKTNVTNYPIYLRTKKFKIGYVPQHGGYFHNLSCLDNLRAIGEIIIKENRKRESKINELISKFELETVRDIKAKFLSGGQTKRLVIALALLGDPEILLLDEPFAALDVLTIKMLQEIIVNLQTQNISLLLCDHQAQSLLACVDVAFILSNCKIIAHGTPSELVNNKDAVDAYFGSAFKYN